MKVEYTNQEYIRGCIKACEKRKHLQQVAFSTFHDCLTQVCFTCNICMTSLPFTQQVKMKKNQSLKGFEELKKECSKKGDEDEN